jgi:alkanesulfonate monooxygenase SsuD/methylene tetrahydromethanopterin reductase-like flavin-dependent oxidoreductase (luciferase family)
MSELKFGVFLPFYAFPSKKASETYTQMKKAVLEAEKQGYNSVWLDDHLMYGDWPILESWTALSAFAMLTSSIRLGTLVNCNAHHHAALLAKAAATLDVISGGRLEFGIGAGCQEREHTAYGFQFADVQTRVIEMAEALEVTKRLWTQPKANFCGKKYKLQDATCEPKPIQKPHPPITVGGAGEKHTLRVTAQYADRADFGFLPSVMDYKEKLAVLERHCKDIGREFKEIERMVWLSGQVLVVNSQKEAKKTVAQLKPEGSPLEEFRRGTLIGTPRDCRKMIKDYADLGVTYFMLYFGDLPNLESMRLFAQKVIKPLC